MSSFLADLLPVLILMAIGMIGGKLRFLDETTIGGMKRLVASVTLPALLFTAFARTGLEASHLALAGVIFLSCGLMGAAGTLFSRLFKLPRPASVFLFQGFEAGMLGYALFASLFPHIAISRFATADLGQVVYVFTVLMSAMIRPAGEPAAKRSSRAVIFGLIRSPVIIAIVSGMAASALFLGKSGIPWAEGGFLDRSLSMVGNLTTPLVSLIVGFGLSDGFKGGRDIVITTAARLALAVPIGIAIAFGLVPLLGISAEYSTAVMVLFLLPPPFVLSIFRKDRKESEFISSVLSLHTMLSLILVAAFAILAPGMLP